MQNKLNAIAYKYRQLTHNQDNYNIGGGLSDGKFASNRHEDARNDKGKLTLGVFCQKIKTATGLPIDFIKEMVKNTLPFLEWHHAGKLPKQYGGGMKKTYFVNSEQIVKFCDNFEVLHDEYIQKIEAEQKEIEQQRKKQIDRQNFLNANAKFFERVPTKPNFFYCTKVEMNGKYGWFDSEYKRYNLPEYFTGYAFENETIFNEFIKLYI